MLHPIFIIRRSWDGIFHLSEWKRNEEFDFFNKMDVPYLSMSSRIEVTQAINFHKKHSISLYAIISWCVMSAINSIPELLMDTDGKIVWQYNQRGCSFTTLTSEDKLNFSSFTMGDNLIEFVSAFNINKQKAEEGQKPNIDKNNIAYLSCVPWIDFLHVSTPMNLSKIDTVPRITWGKVIQENQRYFCTVNLQINHGMGDGLHVSNFFVLLQRFVNKINEY
ncbi:TPA: CatA-like O-acetyltransferase, partial [Streptococcus pneumoniae]|nr:chloramphenicol acetyltransferase [Streptococcus pneumoniae]